METRRLVLLMLFSFSLIMLWNNYQVSIGQPSLFDVGTPQQTASLNEKSIQKNLAVDVPSPTVINTAATPNLASSTDHSAAAPQVITVKTDLIEVDFSTEGAQIVGLRLLNQPDSVDPKKPMHLFSNLPNDTYLGQVGLIGVEGAPNHRSVFKFQEGSKTLESNQQSLDVRFVSTTGNTKVEYTYTLHRARHDIGLTAKVLNQSTQAISPSVYMQITRDGNPLPNTSKFYSTFTGPAVYSPEGKYQKISFSNIDKHEAKFTKNTNSGWLGMVQHYFVSAIIPPEGPRENYSLLIKPNLYSIGFKAPLGSIAPSAEKTWQATLYSGPQNQHVLSKLSEGLDLVVDYGLLVVIARPIYWLLEKIHLLVNNWGWSIILLTCLIKLIFFPLSAASYRSMAKMRQVAPRMQKLKEQHGDDKVAFQRAMMELYKREKINPLGGCMPILIQIPVFISLYWVLLGSVEMRGAPWLWVHDLTLPEAFFVIPFIDMPVGVLPVLMALSMFIQTRLNPTPPDPMQAKLMMIMPMVFSFMFFFFPSGLVLYWVVNNILSIAQQWVITRKIVTS